MIRAVDIKAELAGRPQLRGRDKDTTEAEAKAAFAVLVPQGHWHRFHAPDGVTVLTATPQPTDHTAAADPRTVA